ncbi:AraC-like ligand-binding domain-containing protein [Pseudomonas oryzae]|uniref:Transcriptional regulator, AraC family n=1 Tax=Pseudomonas oryzae TaxID=1392877 RepID=A0A1H1YA85_9PSED|nr:AraC family transcriptional regulator [Pseudomonas oryzae]SDT17916.1 transcriptional regulator, AraC family [Pseudomonas oryzae]
MTPPAASPLLAELDSLSQRAAQLREQAQWRLSTRDPAQASSGLHESYSPHRMQLHGDPAAFEMRLARQPLGSLELSCLSFGTEVELEQAWTTDFVLVTTQLCGHSRIRTRGDEVGGAAGLIVVDSPERPVTKRFSPDSWRLNLRIERQAMERLFERLYERPLRGPMQFHPAIAQDSALHERWLALLRLVSSQLGMPSAPALLGPLEEMAMLLLLTELPHNQAAGAVAPPLPAPRHVRRAEEFMRAHLGEPLTLAAIAAASGTSIRSLTAGFRQFRQTTPMRWLHEQRLQAARDQLQQAASDASVSSIALHCGFGHLGRFAGDYLRRFGEAPSATLRRR